MLKLFKSCTNQFEFFVQDKTIFFLILYKLGWLILYKVRLKLFWPCTNWIFVFWARTTNSL